MRGFVPLALAATLVLQFEVVCMVVAFVIVVVNAFTRDPCTARLVGRRPRAVREPRSWSLVRPILIWLACSVGFITVVALLLLVPAPVGAKAAVTIGVVVSAVFWGFVCSWCSKFINSSTRQR